MLEVEFDSVFGIAKSRLWGSVSPEELRRETIQLAEIAEEHSCSLFMSDFSDADVEFNVVDVYELPDLQEEEGLDRSVRIAVLPPRLDKGHQLARFYETVSVNRGWTVGLFSDQMEAVSWLTSQSEDETQWVSEQN